MHDGEHCQECGMPIAFFTRSWWDSDDSLWEKVMGPGNGSIVCPPCFTSIARSKRIWIHWQAVESD